MMWSSYGLVVGTTLGSCVWFAKQGSQETADEGSRKGTDTQEEHCPPQLDDLSQEGLMSQQPRESQPDSTGGEHRVELSGTSLGQAGTLLKECSQDSMTLQDSHDLCTQRAFQPGATQNVKLRYLACNEHGTLKHVAAATDRHDRHGRNQRRSARGGRLQVNYSRERGAFTLRDHQAPEGLVMGSIGPVACAVATDSCHSKPGKIVCYIAKPWKQSSFEVDLQVGERVEALAVGRDFFAVMISPVRLLRIFSLHGVCLGAIAVCGAPVCLAACEDLLLCVTAVPGNGGEGSPLLEFALYGVKDKERLSRGRMPVSPGSILRWVGFSREALPLALDNKGTLRALGLSGGGPPSLAANVGEWVPILQLESRGARLWPVGSDSGDFLCADTLKDWEEPHPGRLLKLRKLRMNIPLGEVAELQTGWVRERFLASHLSFALESDLVPSSQRAMLREVASKNQKMVSNASLAMFDNLLKSGDLHKAADVVSLYMLLTSSTDQGQRLLRILEEARRKADAAGHDRLSGHIDDHLATLRPAFANNLQLHRASGHEEVSAFSREGKRRNVELAGIEDEDAGRPSLRHRMS